MLFCCFADTLFCCFTDTLLSIWIHNTGSEMKHDYGSIYLQFAADRLNPCIASINMRLYESMIYTSTLKSEKSMAKDPIYLAFSTQKGGAGKTTLTVLVASYLHYVKGYDVAVIDCDYPQHSIVEMRGRDLKMAKEDEYYRNLAYEQFTRLNKKAYPVIESSTEKSIDDAERITSQADFDIVFFDLPGTVNNPSVIRALSNMDYIFAPISADRVVLESTLRYMTVVNDVIRKTGVTNIKDTYLVWNMVDGREKTELYEVYEQVISTLGLKVLKTFLPNSLRFRKELPGSYRSIFRSTLFPADRSQLRGSNIEPLTQEILTLIKLDRDGEKS